MSLKASAYFLLLFALPPFFWGSPRHNEAPVPVLFDSAYVAVVAAFAEKGVPINYTSNPHLYAEVYKWLGTPHRRRGQNGIDCSGLVKIVFRNVYQMELTGGSNEMALRVIPVEKENLREGDLVFFRIYQRNRIDHVGIYLGGNRFVHTSSSRGVIVSDLSEPYYRRTYVKAGRMRELQPNIASVAEDQ